MYSILVSFIVIIIFVALCFKFYSIYLLNSVYKEYLVDREQNTGDNLQFTIDNALENIPCYAQISQRALTKKDLMNDSCINKTITPLRFSIGMSTNSWSDNTESTATIFGLIYTFLRFITSNTNAVAITTGGTSGNSFYYWYTVPEMKEFIKSYFYCWDTFGWDPSKKVLVYYGHPSGGLQMIKYFTGCNVRALVPVFNKGDITEASIVEFISTIEYQRPFIVESMPNVIFRVAQYMYRKGIVLAHKLGGLSLSGDFLFECQYQFIKRVFQDVPIRLSYGTVEFGQIAQQASDGDLYTYKVFTPIAKVENVGKTLAITRYKYRNMPIIRYNIDDIGIVSVDGNYIHNLVGKNKTNIDLIAISNLVHATNNDDIINVRVEGDTLRLVAVAPIPDRTLFNLQRQTGYAIRVDLCTEESCHTTDNLEKKVIPIREIGSSSVVAGSP
jgi:hypothetical protein